MILSRFRKHVLLLSVVALVPAALPAATATYDFTYSGASPSPGTTAVGSGSFTLTYSSLGVQSGSFVSAFSFTDAITQGTTTSTYTYGLANVTSESADLSGSMTAPTLASLIIGTGTVSGTPTSFGPTNFTLEDSAGVINDSTNGATTQTSGGGTVTFVPGTSPASVPEPSTTGLLGLGVLGVVVFFRFCRKAV